MPYEKTSVQKSIIGKGGVKSSRMSFYGRLRSGWMKTDKGEGGQKRPKMGGRPLYKPPYGEWDLWGLI